MSAFDRYVAVDWSASNSPVTGKDSIWLGEASRTASGIDLRPSHNPRTRSEAMAVVEDLLLHAMSRGERVLLGFDFVFGYPTGAAQPSRAGLAGNHWRRLAVSSKI